MIDTSHPSMRLINQKEYTLLQELIESCVSILAFSEQNAFIKSMPGFQHLKKVMDNVNPTENKTFESQPPDIYVGLFNIEQKGERPVTAFDFRADPPIAATTLCVSEMEMPNLCELCSGIAEANNSHWRLIKYIPVKGLDPFEYNPFMEMKGEA